MTQNKKKNIFNFLENNTSNLYNEQYYFHTLSRDILLTITVKATVTRDFIFSISTKIKYKQI